ncbi:Asp-tRNA(Asn)/Glu-tRNA(Gln) amidotransferase A subunit family amidase [Ensifer mexicanus]|nr:Asp-tRNA(Asn)/Glu-tRNA(Gln) amidotransferase A subunit family amidase [Sinorhizobium mexicanum]
MMNVISGNDPRDGHAGPRHQYRRDVSHTIKGMRIAFSPTLGYASVADDIATVVANAVEYLAEMGADVTEVDPGFSDPIDVMETLVFAGFARILRTLNGSQIALLDPGFLKAAERGLSLSLPNYQDAQEARANLKARMNEFHEKFELLITPTVPIAPFEAGKDVPDPRYEKWTDWSPFTYPFNLTQQPAASLPAGLDTSGLPVGLQIVGAQFADSTVLAVSQLLEKQLGLLAPPNNAAK